MDASFEDDPGEGRTERTDFSIGHPRGLNRQGKRVSGPGTEASSPPGLRHSEPAHTMCAGLNGLYGLLPRPVKAEAPEGEGDASQ
jgi:hypothetical protein